MGVEGGLGVGDSSSSFSSVSMMISTSNGCLSRRWGLGVERYREGSSYSLVKRYPLIPLSMCATVGKNVMFHFDNGIWR